jgi:hypothetical protein
VRALVVLVALTCSVDAAPKYTRAPSTSPALADAEKLWQAAATEPDKYKQPEAWEKAAQAFIAIVDAGNASQAEQRQAAHAAMLAMKNALQVDPRARTEPRDDKPIDYSKAPTPQPIPEREAKMLRVFETYLKVDSTSDDAIGVKFLRANVLRRHGHLDPAIAIFLDILAKHPAHEVAEYSANLALDSYNRLRRYDELVALAVRLDADKAFLAGKHDLAETVRRIRIASLRRRAEKLESMAKDSRELADYDRCGDEYAAIAKGVKGRERDEVLYNALVCFEQAGSLERFRAIAAKLDVKATDPKLRARAVARRAVVEGNVGNFAAAADALEHYIVLAPGEKDAADAASDAIYYRLALGEVARAERVLARLERLGHRALYSPVPSHKLRIVFELLAAGKRSDARALARSFATSTDWARLGISPLQAVMILGDAACPVPLIDGLCPGLRDNTVMFNVQETLARISGDHDAELGRLIQADLDLEIVLAKRRGTTIENVTAAYRRLATSGNADIRVTAHARLARLAHRRKSDPRGELEACIREARAAESDSWQEHCEREHAKLDLPPIDPLTERLPAANRDLPIAIETLRR